MTYERFFAIAMGRSDAEPYAYQRDLVEANAWPTTIEVPTGLGKTEAVVLAWLYRRYNGSTSEPRRLVYCLPMRTLVEQTRDRIEHMLTNLRNEGVAGLPNVAIEMGGIPKPDQRSLLSYWLADPVSCWIIIGTQDMLVSRALNRGYGMSRFQWPMAFAWLNNDALWVVDEVQLHGTGATTAAQLQGFRERSFGIFGSSATIFVSATTTAALIDTPDHSMEGRVRLDLTGNEVDPRVRKIIQARKTSHHLDAYEEDALAAAIVERHRAGTRTLIIVNTVDRATKIYRRVAKLLPSVPVVLLHSRFRSIDRETHLRSAVDDLDERGLIVVATQVVEAGVDFSATTLISDVAPWSSIVQRLGRCNRRGDDADAAFFWLAPPEYTATLARPYRVVDLEAARAQLSSLEGCSLGPSDLPTVTTSIEPGATLRRVDIVELFDTASDLSGNDIDVSRFIREADEFNVQVFWRTEPPTPSTPPRREELCPVPKGNVEKLIKRLREARHGDLVRRSVVNVTEGKNGANRFATSWLPAPLELAIGDVVWLDCSVGAYVTDVGFDASSGAPVLPILSSASQIDPASVEDETIGGDERSVSGVAVNLTTHSEDAADAARILVGGLDRILGSRFATVVERAARWHDVGKVHDVFQATMHSTGLGAAGGPWAKSALRGRHHRRRFFRHELASALAWLDSNDGEPESSLIAFLILAHHGKARVSVYSQPGEPIGNRKLILGIEDGDEIGSVDLGAGERSHGFTVDLSLFDMGSANGRPTWSERIAMLTSDAELGIFRLAYLESLVRVADWRASDLHKDAELATLEYVT